TCIKAADRRICRWAPMTSVSVRTCAYTTPCLEISALHQARSATRVSSGFCLTYLRTSVDVKLSEEHPSLEITRWSTPSFKIHSVSTVWILNWDSLTNTPRLRQALSGKMR